jgi:hypothetical protein
MIPSIILKFKFKIRIIHYKLIITLRGDILVNEGMPPEIIITASRLYPHFPTSPV